MVRKNDEDSPWIPLCARLPDVSGVGQPRRIYVDGLDADEGRVLRDRGYDPVELMALPRDTEGHQLAYLRAKLQAFEERTVAASEEDRKRLELEARAWGMLGAQKRQIAVDVNTGSDDVAKLLEWETGRHTLAGNTTAVFAQPPDVNKPKRKRS